MLRDYCGATYHVNVGWELLPGGAMLVRIPDLPCAGWSREKVTVLFVVPPAYPAGQPDCFWVEPGGFRVLGGAMPQNTSDGNAIPGDPAPGRSTTWFSWHVQSWNPSRDTVTTYFRVVVDRLKLAR